MRLSNEQFKRFRELGAKIKAKKATQEEVKEYNDLQAMRNDRGSNDIAWWKNYPELLAGVVNLPFNWIPGTGVAITGPGAASVEVNFGVIAIAKVATAIGLSTKDSDPFNSQIRRLWLDMHRKYRGIGTYEKSDLGIAILAINEFFKTLAKFERIYGVINTYHVANRVVPFGLKDALGIADSLETNLADFRYILNLYINKAKQLCLPKGLSILTSDIVMLSNLFKDSKDRRAFIFGFDTDMLGIYKPTAISTGGCVVYEDYSANYMNSSTPSGYSAFTLTDIQQALQDQLDALLNDTDISIMCSDLIAAYGPENVMQLIPVPEDYKVEPVEDYERSLQFHNLTIVGQVATIYEDSVVSNTDANAFLSNSQRVVIYQANNTIKCRLGKTDGVNSYTLVSGFNYPSYLRAAFPNQGKTSEVLFDTWVEQPGEAEIMCGTRFMCTVGPEVTVSSTVSRQEIFDFGSNVVQAVEVYTFRKTQNDYHQFTISGSVLNASHFTGNYQSYCKLLQMDWAPVLYINNSTDLVIFGDIDNFTKISNNNLNRLHEVALLSGYFIPMVSKD